MTTVPIITYYTSNQPYIENWFIGDIRLKKRHREDGPAYKLWYPDGQIKYEIWFNQGLYHRENGPCSQWWHPNGQIEYKSWFIHNKCHRIDGPAEIEWDDDGYLIFEKWYINDEELSDIRVTIYKKWLKGHNLYKPYDTWSDEERVLWRLSWT